MRSPSWPSCAASSRVRWPDTGCAPASPACTRRRWGATRSSRRTRATAQIGESMRVLARREPTLATHVHVGIADPRAAVRLLNRLRVAPAAPARPVGQLPVLAGQGDGLRVDPHHPLRRLPAHRRAARLSRLRRLGRDGRRAAALGRHRRSLPAVVGRPAAAALRHGRGPHHGCPDDGRGRGRPRRARPVARAARARAARRPGRRAAGQRADRGEPLPGGARRHARRS